MADVPTYESRIRSPQPGNMDVRPQAIPNVSGGAAIGDAVAQLGQAGLKLHDHIRTAQETTRLNQAKAEYLTQLDELEARYAKDTDFQTAPERFDQEHAKIRENVMGGRLGADGQTRTPFSEAAHAKLDASLTTYGTVSRRRVRTVAHAREADANVAALETEGGVLLRNAANAASPTEREAARTQYVSLVENNANAGWIARQAGALRIEKFDGELERADVARMVRDNPAAARAALADPKNFPGLDPTERERAIAAAEGAADTRITLELGAKARFAPETVSLTLDRLADPAHAERIHKSLIIPQESGGKFDAVSGKGALGVSQLMPETAREMARKAGRRDVAELSDADLTKLLTSKEGQALNERLGAAYFSEMLTRYDGRVALALAAYNAGPARADEWKAKAAAQFGDNFTPAQFASVVTFKETRDYLGKIYDRAGAGMNGSGLSPNGVYRAAEHIRTEIGQDEAARKTAARELAANARASDDPAALFQDGFVVDPERLRVFRTTQEAAALAGDRSATEALQKLEHWEAMAPFVRQAYSMPPAALQTAVATMEAALAASPSVSLEQKRRLDAFREVATEVEKRKNSDPVSLGERAFNWQSVALDPQAQITDPNFRAALVARSRQAERAADVYGGAVRPFKPAEAEAWKQRYAEMPEGERHALLGTLAETMPERSFRAALSQIGSSATDVTAGLLGRDRPELGRKILHGAALLKTEGVKPAAKDLRDALASRVKGELYPDPRMQDAVVDAALAVYAADRGTNGALYDAGDGDALERAVEQVTGPIVKRNGVRTPAWPGMSAAAFEDALEFDERTLTMAGGAIDRNGDRIAASTLAARAIVKPHEPGSPLYWVGMPGGSRDGFVPVLNVAGRPLVVDMRMLAALRTATRAMPLDIGAAP